MTHRAARLRLRRGDLGGPVLERVVGAIAARADLPLDRLSDAQIVSSALVRAALAHSADDALGVEFGTDGAALDMVVGPLNAGSGARIVADSALPGIGPVLERLVDDWSVDSLDTGDEVLRLRIGAGAPTR